MSDKHKHMDIKEFRDEGYLQEANRLFFHPLGLALEVTTDTSDCFSCGGRGYIDVGDVRNKCRTCDGTGKNEYTTLSGVWDYRDDPEGIVFGNGEIEEGKIARVANQQRQLIPGREALIGEGRFIQTAKDDVL